MFLFNDDNETMKPKPADPKAVEFCHKLCDMLCAQERLEKAFAAVPGYTAQYEASDYYAQEQEDFNRCADDLWTFVRDNAKP